jgi:hypothetical protein
MSQQGARRYLKMKYWIIGDDYSGRFLELVVKAETAEEAVEVAKRWYSDPNAELEAVKADFIEVGK